MKLIDSLLRVIVCSKLILSALPLGVFEQVVDRYLRLSTHFDHLTRCYDTLIVICKMLSVNGRCDWTTKIIDSAVNYSHLDCNTLRHIVVGEEVGKSACEFGMVFEYLNSSVAEATNTKPSEQGQPFSQKHTDRLASLSEVWCAAAGLAAKSGKLAEVVVPAQPQFIQLIAALVPTKVSADQARQILKLVHDARAIINDYEGCLCCHMTMMHVWSRDCLAARMADALQLSQSTHTGWRIVFTMVLFIWQYIAKVDTRSVIDSYVMLFEDLQDTRIFSSRLVQEIVLSAIALLQLLGFPHLGLGLVELLDPCPLEKKFELLLQVDQPSRAGDLISRHRDKLSIPTLERQLAVESAQLVPGASSDGLGECDELVQSKSLYLQGDLLSSYKRAKILYEGLLAAIKSGRFDGVQLWSAYQVA